MSDSTYIRVTDKFVVEVQVAFPEDMQDHINQTLRNATRGVELPEVFTEEIACSLVVRALDMADSIEVVEVLKGAGFPQVPITHHVQVTDSLRISTWVDDGVEALAEIIRTRYFIPDETSFKNFQQVLRASLRECGWTR